MLTNLSLSWGEMAWTCRPTHREHEPASMCTVRMSGGGGERTEGVGGLDGGICLVLTCTVTYCHH